MSPVLPLLRQVPTLTEVLEETSLGALPAQGFGQGLDLELEAPAELMPGCVESDAEQRKQAILALVDKAIEEFRTELLSRLEPLLDQGSARQSD
ncbi:hypothetical protein [Roseateles albus]|uniref:Uncharacterized protein n=1 Tax=Roseateles albus TaxID=2987525 RepID=A0ABT5KKS2_9BURK|nr:hypothetical protein [Roseateles albus]MDC8773987.1 hypothetical protein [Roseateles albus]